LLHRLARISFGLSVATVAVLATVLAARLLLPTLPLPHPAVEATVPAPGASNVLPLNPLTLRFDQRMNRASVERALRLDPPLPGVLIWRDAGRTLVFSPTQALAANTTYRLMLDQGARGWLFQPLPPYELAFRTTPAPTVTSLLPADGARDVARDAVLSVSFSRPMIPPELIGRALTLPELQLEPPVAHTTTWLDQSTLLVRPAERLLPGTTYTITLAPELRDLTRSALGQAVRWHIRTAAPAVADLAPRDGQRDVGLRQPLVISLTEALDEGAVANALRITPPISGSLAAAPLAPEMGAAQIITFTPEREWPTGTTVSVVLPSGTRPAQGQFGLQAGARWSFRTADQPRVVGRFPGEGQQLPVAQDVRLVFNTRFEAQALTSALLLDPPVEQVSLQGEGGEFRVVAPLRPSTAYTITLPATLTDTNGVALGRDYVLRFVTAPPLPALALPDVVGHFLTLSPGEEQVLQLEQVNISAGEMALYALDQASLVRTLGFGERDWREFEPERYGLRELARAPLPPSEQPDTTQRTPVPLSLSAAQPQLDPGAYYVQVVSADGPSLNLVVTVAPVALALKHNAAEVLVWATDAASGTPLADVPLTLYQGGAVVASGQSDADGLWRVGRRAAEGALAYSVVAGDVLGVVSSDWRVASGAAAQQARQQPERYQGLLWSDQRSYQPGDAVTLSAVLRQFANGSLRWPDPGTRLNVSVRPSGAPSLFSQELLLRPGVASTVFRLPPDAAPGRYLVQGTLNGTRLTASFDVMSFDAAPLLVAIEAPSQLVAGATTDVRVRVRSREGLDVGAATVRWQLSCSEDEAAAAQVGCRALQGSGTTDDGGIITASLALPPGAQGLYQLDVTVEEVPGVDGATVLPVVVVPPVQLLDVSAPSLLPVGTALDATMLVGDASGQPLPNQSVALSLRRHTGDGATTQEVLRQEVVSDEGGVARANLAAPQPGRYTLIATAQNAPSREQALYVYAPGFTAWPPEANGTLLVADRATYRPGEIATVLPLLPAEQTTALLVRERPDALEPEVRLVQAGEPFTLTITAADTPALFVSLLAPLPQAPVFVGYVELPVVADAAIRVRLDGPATERPGASVPLTVTVSDAAGQPVRADSALLLAARASGLEADAVLRLQATPQPPGVVTAHSLGRASGARPTSRSSAPEVSGRNNEALAAPPPIGRPAEQATFSQLLTLRGNANGQSVFTATLPLTPIDVQAQALVFADAGRWGQAVAQVAVDEPLRVEPLLPSVLSVGDETELAVRLTNLGATAQMVTVTLTANAIVPQNGTTNRQMIALAPGEATTLRWLGSVGAASEAVVAIGVRLADGLVQQTQARIPIRPSAPQRVLQGGGIAAPQFKADLPATNPPDGALELVVAPTTQAALLEHWQRLNAAQPRDALLEAETLRAGAALARAELLAPSALTPTLERLVAAQRPDGGWSWWPGGETNLYVSAQVALGLAAVDQARVPPDTRNSAGRLLQRALAAAVEPNQQALLGYVLDQLGQPEPARAQTLAQSLNQLNSAGLAALALSLPRDDPAAARVAAALRGRAQVQSDGTTWLATSDGFQPLSATAISARAVQALARLDPADAVLPGARAALLVRYGDGSWGESGAVADVITALAAPLPPAPESYRYVATLDGVEVLARNVTTNLTATQQVLLDTGDLQSGGELRVVADGVGQPLLRYQLRSASAGSAQTGPLALERRYLDVRTGAPLDPLGLALGQLVVVQLTLVVPQEVQFLTVSDPLPGSSAVVLPHADLSLSEHVVIVDDTLRITATRLTPGIYEQRYVVRATTRGEFAVPAPQMLLRYDTAITGSGAAARMHVD
jgi:alpha-2-macroglobulin